MQVLDDDPANWKALFRRGQAHAVMGDTARAVNTLEAALDAAPVSKAREITEKLEAARRALAQMPRDEHEVWMNSRQGFTKCPFTP